LENEQVRLQPVIAAMRSYMGAEKTGRKVASVAAVGCPRASAVHDET
jgi:hypothetical protein